MRDSHNENGCCWDDDCSCLGFTPHDFGPRQTAEAKAPTYDSETINTMVVEIHEYLHSNGWPDGTRVMFIARDPADDDVVLTVTDEPDRKSMIKSLHVALKADTERLLDEPVPTVAQIGEATADGGEIPSLAALATALRISLNRADVSVGYGKEKSGAPALFVYVYGKGEAPSVPDLYAGVKVYVKMIGLVVPASSEVRADG